MRYNILKYAFLILAVLGVSLTGCEDLNEDLSGVKGSDTYYSDEYTFESGLIGIYARLHRVTWSLDYQATASGADDITTRPGSNKWVIREADLFEKSGGNSWYTNAWNGYYQVILAANQFIEKANPESVDEEIVNAAQASAHFARGLVYFRLAAIWGDIPMPLSAVPDLTLSKTPKREVMAQVIKDFEFAAKWASNPRDTDPSVVDGHASKTAAKAFLAKTYMQLTGWPYNETEHWAKVKQLTKEIIDAGVYSLTDDFAASFQLPTENNKEVLFAHYCKRDSWPITTQSRVYGFRFANWVDMFMEWNFFNNFPDGYRKSFTCTDQISGNQNSAHDGLVELWDHPFVTKYNYGTVKGRPEFENTWQTSNDMPAMRYSEVLLMYAEACARTSELTEAVEKLNWVKRRAYANGSTTQEEVTALATATPMFWMNADATIDATTGDSDLIDQIILERACEFVGEIGCNRWLDLMRLEMVGTVNKIRDAKELPLTGNPDDKNLWWCPIPDTEIVLNPNLAD